MSRFQKGQEKRVGFEPTNPKDLDLNQAHLTALLPLPKQKILCRMGGNPKILFLQIKPLGRIELPTCSLRVNRSATELKRLANQKKGHPIPGIEPEATG